MVGIKDFGMPSCCVNCQMCDAYEQGTCVITETECEDMYSQRNDDCPLVEITESDDSVSIAELLKALDTWDKFGVDDTGHLFRLDNLSYPHYEPYIHYRDVIKAVKGMPSVQPKRDKGEWIPIKNLKDIPQGKEILVCDCDGLIKIGYAVTYRFKGFDKEDDIRVSDSGGDRIKGIVAYMPLPKPYEPQESEDKICLK